jgi:hypothetical protein
VATQLSAMPPNSFRLTNDAASLLQPFSTMPRLRPAPISAPTYTKGKEGWGKK